MPGRRKLPPTPEQQYAAEQIPGRVAQARQRWADHRAGAVQASADYSVQSQPGRGDQEAAAQAARDFDRHNRGADNAVSDLHDLARMAQAVADPEPARSGFFGRRRG